MGEKTTKIHEFDPQIYPRLLWIAVGAPNEVIKDMFEDVEPMPEKANAQVDYTRRLKPDMKGGILIRFKNKKALTAVNITHEAVHAAGWIFQYIEARYDIENDEPFAYLCGWIAKCIDEVKRGKI